MPDIASPWIIAHRGAMREAPENTLAAFEAAGKHGVQGVEFDVQLSRDEVPVIYHDGSLGRLVPGSRKRIADLTCDQLGRLDFSRWPGGGPAFEEERIPTLATVLTRYAKSLNLFVEIKTFASDRRNGRARSLTRIVLDQMGRMVAPADRSHLHILSFDPTVITYAALEAPDVKYVLNVPAKSVGRGAYGVPWKKLFGLCASIASLTRAFADEVHSRGCRLLTYGCNTAVQYEKALRLGADMVMTDDPAWLVRHASPRPPA